jgi:hypothetical protein
MLGFLGVLGLSHSQPLIYERSIVVSEPSAESVADPMSYFVVRQNVFCNSKNVLSVWIKQIIPYDTNLPAYNLTRNSTVNILPYACDSIQKNQTLQNSYKVNVILEVNSTGIASAANSDLFSIFGSLAAVIGIPAAIVVVVWLCCIRSIVKEDKKKFVNASADCGRITTKAVCSVLCYYQEDKKQEDDGITIGPEADTKLDRRQS